MAPKLQYSDYRLDLLTTHDEITHTHEQNAAAWRNLLSVEEYVAREHVLLLSKIASSEVSRVVVFGLRHVSSPTLLSSVELFVRHSWRYHRDATGKPVKTPILSGCVGGLFTYPENRGKGIAQVMVDKLVEIAKSSDFLGTDGFTILYSEVGEYYTRNGFKSFPVLLTNVAIAPLDAEYVAPDGVELVGYHDFEDLFKVYAESFHAETLAKVAADGIDRVAIDPVSGLVDWFHVRVKYFATKLFREKIEFDPFKMSYEELNDIFTKVEPHFFGLKLVQPGTNELRGFIVWQYEYDQDKTGAFSNYATVIKIHVNNTLGDVDSISHELILAMQAYLGAKHASPQLQNIKKIVIWESEISTALKERFVGEGAVHGLENSSRSAMLYNNEEDDEKLKEGRIIWENNTKLPWF